MKKLLAGTALCLSLSTHAVSAQEFSNLVIFGDSLSDTGNIAKIVPASVLATIPTGTPGVPIPPYYDFRFSNGPIYADTLGAHLGITSPTLDFAVGGAFSGKLNETIGAVPVSGVNLSPLLNGLNAVTPLTPVPIDTSVQGQIVNYLTSGAGVSSKGLYVVWGGANDYHHRHQPHHRRRRPGQGRRQELRGADPPQSRRHAQPQWLDDDRATRVAGHLRA